MSEASEKSFRASVKACRRAFSTLCGFVLLLGLSNIFVQEAILRGHGYRLVTLIIIATIPILAGGMPVALIAYCLSRSRRVVINNNGVFVKGMLYRRSFSFEEVSRMTTVEGPTKESMEIHLKPYKGIPIRIFGFEDMPSIRQEIAKRVLPGTVRKEKHRRIDWYRPLIQLTPVGLVLLLFAIAFRAGWIQPLIE